MRSFIKILCGVLLSVTSLAAAAAAPKEPVRDFPPGVFSDNGTYKLDDFKGKTLVLFFYEKDCPSCRASIPGRNELVERLQGRPVKFIAVAAGDSLAEARAYVNETKLAMPVFADPLSLMEDAFLDKRISLSNIYQMRVVTPQGQVVYTPFNGSGVEKLAEQATWKYKDSGYDPKLGVPIELLEWNQWEAGLKALKPFRKNSNKDLAASAEKLYEAVKADATAWQTEADAVVETNPVGAYDLYTRVKACFAEEEIGKSADTALKKLKTSKPLNDELAARKQFLRVNQAIASARPDQKREIAAFCQTIVKQYPDTPTAERARGLAAKLGG